MYHEKYPHREKSNLLNGEHDGKKIKIWRKIIIQRKQIDTQQRQNKNVKK